MEKCVKCGKKRKQLSQRKICAGCKELINKNATAQMILKEGPYFDRWKAGMQRYAEGLK